MVLQIAYKLQEKVKEKTPVDTHILQDGWKVGRINKVGNEYVVEVVNNTEYAEFVEEGHRLQDGTFKEGVHMMELSLEEIHDMLPSHLQRWINNFISTHDFT